MAASTPDPDARRPPSPLNLPLRRCAIGLGSNLGDRWAALVEARARLLEWLPAGSSLLASAPVYESEPVDCAGDAPPFLNTVLLLQVTVDPDNLLNMAQAVERAMGRPDQRGPNEPRVIDVDLLFVGDFCCKEAHLVLPHPRLHLRRFVLQPLVEVAPEERLPGLASPRELLAALADDEPPLRCHAPHW
jgi:2-amino-4-hydroxy-6-hydroxymethyldihydropteridine diphosphokinase